jgi:ABC-2 type transport system permease protein
MSPLAGVAALAPPRRAVWRAPSLPQAVGWEASKLAAQLRTRATLLLCLIAPPFIDLIVRGQGRPPRDSLFGRYIHHSGYATPLLLLGYAGQWVLPLLTALVAGDIFAGEDSHGTWKTVLTRSASRSQLFWAKTVTALGFAVAVLVVLAASTIAGSVLILGHQPLIGLTGQLIAPGHALGLVVASWATALPPLIGFTCLAILFSVLTRNPAAGIAAPVVLGMVMQLAGTLGGMETVRPFLLSTPFEAWHGLLAEHPFYTPLVLGSIASAAWSAVCLTSAFIALRRRDITGG